jgi:hypothetical protein
MLLALMLVHLVLVFDVIRRKTPTVDEVAHVPAGLSYLDTGRFSVYPHNPPLARLVMALAAATAEPRRYYGGTWTIHEPVDHWAFAFEFLWANRGDPQRYLSCLTRARLAIACWSVLTIPLAYFWGSWWAGRSVGFLAAALWTLSPNIIAHASLATTDLAATSTGFAASFFFARWLDRPSWQRAGFAGLGLGLAQLVKFSSLWLIVLWPLWAVLHVARESLADPSSRNSRLARLVCSWRIITTQAGRQFLAIFLIGIAVVNAGYLFEGFGRSLGSYRFVSLLLTRPRIAADGPPEVSSSRSYNNVWIERVNRFRGTLLGALPCVLPQHYVEGFDQQKFEADGKYQMYLRGQLRHLEGENERSGWWYYYLYALAIKVPLSTWSLIALALAGAIRAAAVRSSIATWGLLALVPLAAMSFLTDINIGLRYVLPIFPYLFLIAATAAKPARSIVARSIIVACIAWNMVGLARSHPHELSFFNELVGGPANGRFHLIDSNLDWGQDLRGLARWLDKHPDWRDVRLAYMGTVPPEMEGMNEYRLAPRDLRRVPEPLWLPGEDPENLSSWGPQPGKFAISVNFERGMQFHSPRPVSLPLEAFGSRPSPVLPGSLGQLLFFPAGAFDYFRRFEPRIESEIGYSILLYEVTLADANRVRQELDLPLLPERK